MILARPQPRRVLMTADAVGGVWTYAMELCGELGRRGVEVLLATMGPAPTDAQRAEAQAIPSLTLAESTFALEWMDEPWADVEAAGDWLLGLAVDFRPDVIHLNGYAHAALPWNSPVLVVAHSDVLSWWRAVKGEDAPPSWHRYADAVRHGLDAAGLVVAPTQAVADDLSARYGFHRPVRVVPNGRTPNDDARGAKEPVILAAGRLWDKAKNLTALQAVAPDLPWPVLVAGDDRHPDGLNTTTHNVRHLGRLAAADMAARYAQAAVYCLPARYEPFGLSVLEAALAGCALVLGDLPSLREVWDDAALYVPPSDTDALRATLQSLIEDPDCRARLARRARERAETYTAAAMAGRYLGLYGELIAPWGHAPLLRLSGQLQLARRPLPHHPVARTSPPVRQRIQADAYRPVLSFAPVGLESRQRPLPAWDHHGTPIAGARGRGVRAGRLVELHQPAGRAPGRGGGGRPAHRVP